MLGELVDLVLRHLIPRSLLFRSIDRKAFPSNIAEIMFSRCFRTMALEIALTSSIQASDLLFSGQLLYDRINLGKGQVICIVL